MPIKPILSFSLALAVLISPAIGLAQSAPPAETTAPAETGPVVYDVEVVARLPHDPDAFTQGLLWHDGHLYESTGQVGQSQIRKVDPTTGEVLAARDIPADQFGEGLALWDDELVSLTWRNGVIHRWSLEGLEAVRSDPFPYEGWGLTVLGDQLVASDGSATLRFLDPETYAVQREITATLDGKPVPRLNELEAIDGLIWANQWYSQAIVGIDPASGAIRSIVDMSPLVREVAATDPGGVLNGIAHDPQADRWFVTGKLWPTMFEVRLVPRAAEPDAAAR